MKKAVIITENKYPCGDAGAVRQHAFAKMFEGLGYEVVVLGYGTPTNGKLLEFDGVKYVSFRPDSDNILIRSISRALIGFRVLRFLKKNCSDASVIMVVDTLPYAFKLIKKFSDKRGIPLIHDSVEWYSPEEYSNGEKNIQFRLKEKTNLSIIGKGWKVVAISRYLYNHFSERADRVIRIPVIMDIQKMPFSESNENKRSRFVYAGIPGLKDHLREIVAGFCLLPEEQLAQLELHIIGVSGQQLVESCGVSPDAFEILGEALKVYGRVTRDEAVAQVMGADYTVLLRSAELRYAKAGFPTKIVESLACGTPPMCNLSSDLGEYLVDGENSVIIEGEAPEDVCNAVMKALAYKKEKSCLMRNNARRTAEENFDYRHYTEIFGEFLGN